ncbi:lantibiotic dehydratase [Paraliomyxa miuraensis]|uniref:lantibiotic dehydratase n=1 Tax=Paraliomyxa miuraensis TaxID=376150 RepID=UPI002256A5D1|nr:lantibiotic dehydratase [Paraliomyxa miuraensis]MCX4242641.1 lantibiotic dehydratase [Paraliomyxa miuraensis]
MERLRTASGTYEVSGFFAWRVPLLSWDELMSLFHDEEGRRWESPLLREAIWLASPGLLEAVDGERRGPGGRPSPAVDAAVRRYLVRAATRPTPFGLFGAWCAGELGSEARLELLPRARTTRCSRLDAAMLEALVRGLRASVPADQRSYRRNPTSYRVGERLCFGVQTDGGRAEGYELASVLDHPVVSGLLERCDEPLSVAALVEHVVSLEPELAAEDAAALVLELVDAGLLHDELTPPLTTVHPLEAVGAVLERTGAPPELREALARVVASLRRLDAQLVPAKASYDELGRALERLSVSMPPGCPVQVDAERPCARATLPLPVVRALLAGVEAMRRLGARHEPSALDRFRERFEARFGDVEVPLGLALDEDHGVGFDGLHHPARSHPLLVGLGGPASVPRVIWGERERRLSMKLEAIDRGGGLELELDDEDLQACAEVGPLPSSFAVHGMLLGNADDVARGRFTVACSSWAGPPGGRTLGRAAHLGGLERGIAALMQREQAVHGEAVVAEIVHHPDHPERMANVTRRPRLLAHEIDCLGPSSAPPGMRIGLDDLWLSVRGGRLCLRSRRLGREVVPRLTAAHSFRQPWHLPAYRFLCEMQHDPRVGAQSWSWGPFESRTFLPRVRYRRAILAPACWSLAGASIPRTQGRAPDELLAEISALRRQWGIPRWVTVDELAVDLEDPTMIELGLRGPERGAVVRLEELLPATLGMPAMGPEGRYVHELTVPFVRHEDVGEHSAIARPPDVVSVGERRQAVLVPGSSWLQINVFAGGRTIDALLVGPVLEALGELDATSHLRRWFFVRYDDPDRHLRLRLEGEPRWLSREAWPHLLQVLSPHAEAGAVHRIQADTYARELDRYGGMLGIEAAESIFCADSTAALAMLRLGPCGHEAQVQRMLASLDALARDLGLRTLEQRLAVAQQCRSRFIDEHADPAAMRRELGRRYRTLRPACEALGADPPPVAVAELEGVLAERGRAIAAALARLREADPSHVLLGEPARLLPSYWHMHLNRLQSHPSRTLETVLYAFLTRLYAARRARSSRA